MHRFLALLMPVLFALGCYRPAQLTVKSEAASTRVERMPEISGQDHLGNEFSLQSALATGPVVVIFYRGHW